MKKRSMVFENNSTRVIVPLDPMEGEQYAEIVSNEDVVDHNISLLCGMNIGSTPRWKEYSIGKRIVNASLTLMGR